MLNEVLESKDQKKDRPSAEKAPPLAMEPQWLDALVAGCKTEQDLFGPDGVFTRLKGAVMKRLLEAEMTAHLGHEPHERRRSGNVRNGHSKKTVQTESGSVEIAVPRDRDGSFEPQLVKKHQRRLEGFDEKVLALYARGMTTRDIQGHLRELYGTDVSHELISTVTDAVMGDFRAWQERPLASVYPVVYLDALFVSVRDSGQVQKRAFYVAMGIGLDGHRDVLGLWVAQTEGAKLWLAILTELRQRGVEDIFFVCADGLTGLDRAVEATFPRSVFQTCIVHLIRASLRYVSFSDRGELAKMLKKIYTADNEEQARRALDETEAAWGAKYPGAIRAWRNRWAEFVPFLAYSQPIRRILYTTNVIESVNSQLRRILSNRGPFPNDDAVFKLFFLAIGNAKGRWKPAPGWLQILAQLDILFEGRLPA